MTELNVLQQLLSDIDSYNKYIINKITIPCISAHNSTYYNTVWHPVVNDTISFNVYKLINNEYYF